MCGIAGVLSFGKTSFQVTDTYLKRMTDAIAHRGPDGSGTWISRNKQVGLGHRRLSIIDLSDAAAQPMGDEDGSLWLSFNGEIYNHAEIRRDLEQTGRYRWKTDHSDTEVILHAFEHWGIDCIERFRGMFAFAGRPSARVVAGTRPCRHQAAVLQCASRANHVCVGDKGAAAGSGAGTLGR
jgi:asparagine synthase (glutamine-hydrolysing)